MSEAEPLTFAHYEVLSRLGQGAMGVVYLARDRRIGRHVALKVVRPRAFEDVTEAKEFFGRLQREAELTGRLNHPNIATLYEVGYEGRLVSYLAMEYVAGVTLKQRLESGPMEVAPALTITADILRGLAAAHRQGIVHRDVKPANVILQHDGSAKILDFGIARLEDSSLTLDGSFVGTPHYMAPEQVKQQPITPRVDLFALGIVLFEMLTGRKPFSGDSFSAVVYSVTNEPLPRVDELRGDVPPAVRALLERLAAKDPDERFESADAALAELEQIRSGLAAGGASPVVMTSVAPPAVDHRTTPAPGLLLTRVPSAVTGAVIAALLFPLAAWSAWAFRETRRAMPPRHTVAELQAFAAERRALAAARELARQQRSTESKSAYERFVAAHPENLAARAELALLEESLASAVVVEAPPHRNDAGVTASGSKKKGFFRGLRERTRRLFGRDRQ